MTQFYCFVCGKETTRFQENYGIDNFPHCRIHLKEFSDDSIKEVKSNFKRIFGSLASNFIFLPFKKFYEKKKKENSKWKPRTKKGFRKNRVCNGCGHYLAITDHFNKLKMENSGESPLKIFVNKKDKKYEFSLKSDSKRSNRSMTSKATKNSPKKTLKAQFSKIRELFKGFIIFINSCFCGHNIKSYIESSFTKEKLEVEVNNKNIQEIKKSIFENESYDSTLTFELNSILSMGTYQGVRAILQEKGIQLLGLSKFYRLKRKLDEIFISKIIKGIDYEGVYGFVIPPKWLLLSLINEKRMIFESIILSHRHSLRRKHGYAINNEKKAKLQIPSNIDFKYVEFKTQIQMPKLFSNSKKFDSAILTRLNLGEGFDETPCNKMQEKSKYAGLLNFINVSMGSFCQCFDGQLLCCILAYLNKCDPQYQKYHSIFGGNRWNKQISIAFDRIYLFEIEKKNAQKLLQPSKITPKGNTLVFVKFEQNGVCDELQYQQDDGTGKIKKAINTKIELIPSNHDRLKVFFKPIMEKVGENDQFQETYKLSSKMEPKELNELPLNSLFICSLKTGNKKIVRKTVSLAKCSSSHIRKSQPVTTRRGDQNGVHGPKRIGTFIFLLLIHIFNNLFIYNICRKKKNDCKTKFLKCLITCKLVDASVITANDKSLSWKKFLEKLDGPVSRLNDDKVKFFMNYKNDGDEKAKILVELESLVKEFENDITNKNSVDLLFQWLKQFQLFFKSFNETRKFSSNVENCRIITLESFAKELDKQLLFYIHTSPIVKSFPRYMVYRSVWITNILEFLTETDSKGFSCTGKEMMMKVFRNYFENSTKFRKLSMSDYNFENFMNRNENLPNNQHLHTLFSILRRWVIRNPATRSLYFDLNSLEKIKFFGIESFKNQFKNYEFSDFFRDKRNDYKNFINSFFSVDELEIKKILSKKNFNDLRNLENEMNNLRVRTIKYFKDVQQKRFKINFQLVPKEIKEKLNKHQCDRMEKIFPMYKTYLDTSEVKEIEKKEGWFPEWFCSLIFAFMGIGKTFMILTDLCAFFFENRKKGNLPICLIINEKTLCGKTIGDLKYYFEKIPVKRIRNYVLSGVGLNTTKILSILEDISEKGGILCLHPEKLLKICRLCGVWNEDDDKKNGLIIEKNNYFNGEKPEYLINLFKEVMFENENLMLVVDESHLVFSRKFIFSLLCKLKIEIVVLSTGTPLQKYGKIFYSQLYFAFGDNLPTEVISILSNLPSRLEKCSRNGEDENNIIQDLKFVNKVLKEFSNAIYLNLNEKKLDVGCSKYLVFFKPSTFQKKKIDNIPSSKLAVQRNQIFETISTIPKKMESDYRKIKSGVFNFWWRWIKDCRQRKKKGVFCSSQNDILLKWRDFLVKKKKFIVECKILKGDIGSIKKRSKIIEDFQTNEFIEFLGISQKIGGVGVEFTACSDVVIVSLPWNYSDKSQLEERFHRKGQKSFVNIVYPLLLDKEKNINCSVIQKIITKQKAFKLIFTNYNTKKLFFSTEEIKKCISKLNLLGKRSSEITFSFLRNYNRDVKMHDFEEFELIQYVTNFEELLNRIDDFYPENNQLEECKYII